MFTFLVIWAHCVRAKVYRGKNEFEDIDLSGIAYCIGSIDLKPLCKTNKEDFQKCLKLNFFPIVEVIKAFQDNVLEDKLLENIRKTEKKIQKRKNLNK